jgi:hypothetical protein
MNQWNLLPDAFTSIHVFEIRPVDPLEAHPHAVLGLRLAILSRSLSACNIPAVYLTARPSYSESPIECNLVLAFDLWNNLDEAQLPPWSQCNGWFWNPSTLYSGGISDHFSRALTLYYYYHFLSSNLVYFSSFLLFPGFALRPDPFIFQPVAVRIRGAVRIRIIQQSGLQAVICPRSPPPIGSFLLIPPHEQAFSITEIDTSTISVKSLTQDILTIPITTKYVWLTGRSSLLQSVFAVAPAAPEPVAIEPPRPAPSLCGFSGLDFFSFTEREIEEWLNVQTAPEPERPPELPEGEAFLECSELEAAQILVEEIRDPALRRRISDAAFFSLQVFPLNCIVHPASFFQRCIGVGDRSVAPLCAVSAVDSAPLGVPRLVVSVQEKADTVAADQAVAKCLAGAAQSISGRKDVWYVGFFADGLGCAEGLLANYTAQFAHFYAHFGFGAAKRFPMRDGRGFVGFPAGQLEAGIADFFAKLRATQFRCLRLVAFVVGERSLELQNGVPAVFSFLRLATLRAAADAEIQSRAFLVYSAVRQPNVALREPLPGMLRLRCQPPFLLSRENRIAMHIAWDFGTDKSVWIDDAGSIFHVEPNFKLERAKKVFDEIRAEWKASVTFCVLADGLDARQVAECRQNLPAGVPLFAVFPAPAVQGTFERQGIEDYVVFAEPELVGDGGEWEDPIALCYVLSREHPTYKAAIYAGGGRDDLNRFVTAMSQLSWLSVRPGCELRTAGLPPHINALIGQIGAPTSTVTRFDFLPDLDEF